MDANIYWLAIVVMSTLPVVLPLLGIGIGFYLYKRLVVRTQAGAITGNAWHLWIFLGLSGVAIAAYLEWITNGLIPTGIVVGLLVASAVSAVVAVRFKQLRPAVNS